MIINKPKLIIWDFDGVISDTEHLWLTNWQTLLKKRLGIDWDFETVNYHLGGMSPKTKTENLTKLGIVIDNNFIDELKILDWQAMEKMLPVDGVESIFEMEDFAQCIATGGNRDKTEKKLDILGFNHYFQPECIFTAQQVEHGKPEPDLFLFAARQMGYLPEDCIVIEDSLAGLTAAQRAGITAFAYLGCPMNNHPEYIEKVRAMGIKNIFFDMKDVKKALLSIIS